MEENNYQSVISLCMLNIIGLFILLCAILGLDMKLTNIQGTLNNIKSETVYINCEPISTEDNLELPINVLEISAIAEDEFYSHMSALEITDDYEIWWNEYKEIINKYADVIDAPETLYDYFTEEEIEIMARCVETETHGQDFESKTHVASVIFNRMNSEAYSDNVEEVVTAKGQFAYHRTNISEDTYEAIRFAFEIMDTAQGAMYFHSNNKTDTFCGRPWIFTDECGHHFY